ncbi:hypothetical protein KAI30_00590 [Candidatus Bathyarchaeota archaeon]|jgi:hypothetical protein|nr:hypothetical protein [Candidatus Bathyarchaeota archaeon]
MELYEPDIICPNPKCGKVFGDPLLLNDLSKTPAESYYVCPHCIIKLNKIPIQDKEPRRSIPIPVEPPKKLEETNSTSCPHHFGYLKTHATDASLSDECLTCSKLLQCMLKR